MEALADRLAFVRPPFNLANVAEAADDFHADLLVLDYIQRIPPPGEHGDKRGSVDASMNYLRQFADAGVAVVVVAAVSRGKDSKGRSSYASDALSLASFRESSELEFGADDAFILTTDDRARDAATLRHLKCRHGDARDLALHFDRPFQKFTCRTMGEPWDPAAFPKSSPGHEELSALWQRSPTAAEGEVP